MRAIQIAALAGGAGCGLAGFENCCCSKGTPGRVVRKLHHRHAAGHDGLAGGTMGKLPHASVNLNCRDDLVANTARYKDRSELLLAPPVPRGNRGPSVKCDAPQRQSRAGPRQIYAG